jgi:hypothetical protein
MPSYCHGETLPCMVTNTAADAWLTPNTQSQCLSSTQLGILMQDADRAYCNRFTGSHGGYNATSLAIYPFLREIVDGLYASLDDAIAQADSNSNKNKKMNIYSGHDTVIAPVLAALGVFENDLYCKWPSYASRIAFELWKPAANSPYFTANAQANTQPTASTLSASSTEAKMLPIVSKENSHFVRVVYNGDDVTMLIPACSSGRVYVNGHQMCPLSTLHQQVESLLRPHNSIKAACV